MQNSEKMNDNYSIKAIYEGHMADVRVVTAAHVPEGSFITGSRDCLVKLWVPVNENEYKDEHIFMGATKFIASLCALPPSDQYPHGLILAGSNDCSIYGFSLGNKNPVMKLHGHSDVVCSLSSGFGVFVSGSWDKTARIWSGQQCIAVLEGHDQAVWATQVYPEQNIILTGSADRTIRIWRFGDCENILYGHEDCVRGLVVAPNLTFFSCSNDGTVRLWNIQGQCLNVYSCHDNYIYSVALLNNGTDTDFVTCSEDQSVKVWKKGQSVQTIEIKSKTLWSVICLSNEDIIVGSSDGSVYVIGKGNFTPAIPNKMNDVWVENKFNGGFSVASDSLLPKKGDLDTLSEREKEFELFLEVAGTIRKLAFDRTENPSDVAEKFAIENSLDISNIPELIQLIVQNSELKMPFKPNNYFPLENYFFYTNANVAGLKAKLLEFNRNAPESMRIPPSKIEELVEVANFPDVVSESQMQSLDIAVSWKDDYLFPVLDLLRLAVRCKDVCRRICNTSFMNHLLEILKSEKSVNRILVVKILCNLFGVVEGEQIMMKYQERISEAVNHALIISDDKIHKSCLSLFLNYAVATNKGLTIDVNLYCCNLVDMLRIVTDADCFYKGFLSIGTICVASYPALLKFHSLNVIQILQCSQKYVESPSALEVLSFLLQNFQS